MSQTVDIMWGFEVLPQAASARAGLCVGRGLGGGKDGFEVWSTGDQMSDATERLRTVSAAANGGQNLLEINDAGGSQLQTLGIARAITTDKGASYSLGFDLAGRLG